MISGALLFHAASSALVFTVAAAPAPAPTPGARALRAAAGAHGDVAAQPEDPTGARWCRACHTQPELSEERMARVSHGSANAVRCDDCHVGNQFNPHRKVQAPNVPGVDAVKRYNPRDPVALASCLTCHPDATKTPGVMPHGKPGDKAGSPYCLDCHGEPHQIAPTAHMSPRDKRLMWNARCERCHADEEKMAAAGVTLIAAETYEHSIHAHKLELGYEGAPGCVDCHGAHNQRDMSDIDQRVAACKQCHEDANPTFAMLVDHKPQDAEHHPAAYWTKKAFAWLTFLSILALILHVLIDLFATIREARAKEQGHG